LNNQINVPQGDILNLRLRGQKSNKWRRHFLTEIPNYIRASNELHLQKDNLKMK
jgi:hypothetical protein